VENLEEVGAEFIHKPLGGLFSNSFVGVRQVPDEGRAIRGKPQVSDVEGLPGGRRGGHRLSLDAVPIGPPSSAWSSGSGGFFLRFLPFFNG